MKKNKQQSITTTFLHIRIYIKINKKLVSKWTLSGAASRPKCVTIDIPKTDNHSNWIKQPFQSMKVNKLKCQPQTSPFVKK